MQHLNKRFYNFFTPALVQSVKLYDLGNVSCGIMVFPGQESFVSVLDFQKGYKWVKQPIKSSCFSGDSNTVEVIERLAKQEQ